MAYERVTPTYKEYSTSTSACTVLFVFDTPWRWRLCAETCGSCL